MYRQRKLNVSSAEAFIHIVTLPRRRTDASNFQAFILANFDGGTARVKLKIYIENFHFTEHAFNSEGETGFANGKSIHISGIQCDDSARLIVVPLGK